MDNLNELVSRRLKEVRLRKGLTQKQIADKAGVSMQAISNYENGHAPTLENLIVIAETLDVPIGWLVGENSTQRPCTLADAFQTIIDLETALGTDIQGDFPKPLADALLAIHTVRDSPNLRSVYAACKAGIISMLTDYKIGENNG